MKFSHRSTFSDQQISQEIQKISNYFDTLNKALNSKNYDLPEGSINLPSDQELLEKVKEAISQKVTPKLKYIIDIGIGGSNLGTKAVYDCFFGFFDLVEPNRFPKIIFADTNDPEFLSKLASFLEKIQDPEEVLVNLISKSGTTTESIFNAEVVLSAIMSRESRDIADPHLSYRKGVFEDQDGRPTETFANLVITTDQGSKLWNFAKEKNITVLEIPKQVGGRYSIFSSVGLFPLLAAGVNVAELRRGAAEMVNICLENSLNNPAITSAVIVYLSTKTGKNINDNFFFHPELESVGKWYRQLMAESLGKDGTSVPSPTVSIGSTDLHSMVQLYLGGPKDKLTTFVSTEKPKSDISISSDQIFPDFVDGISGKNASKIMQAILEGVKIAYSKKELPFMEIVLEEIDEYELGQFLQFKMIEMMFLGQLFGVNTFNQPNVEDYKIETKKLLNG